MSSPTVRQAARDLTGSGAWPSSIPYNESFNIYVDGADIKGAWSTLDFDIESDERIAIGLHEYLERGTISIHMFAERGKSYAELENAFDAVRPVVLGHLWPASISILSCAAPEVISPGGVGMHVEGLVAVRYIYQHQGGT